LRVEKILKKNLMLKKCVFLHIQSTKNYLINAKYKTTRW
jgi:hypothetical protein